MANPKTKTKTERIKLYKNTVEIDFYPNSHRYKDINTGEWLTSVTAATGVVDKSRVLIYWAVNLMRDFLFEFIDDTQSFSLGTLKKQIVEASKQHQVKKEEAATIGDLAHKWAEDYIKSRIEGTPEPEYPKDEKVQTAITGFMEWVNSHKIVFHSSEKMVYSKKYNFVGKLDAVATVDGVVTLIDFKTSKAIYDEFLFQVAGYRLAYNEMAAFEGDPLIKKTIILRFEKDWEEGKEFFESREAPNYDQDAATFIACLTIKNRLKELQKLNF